MKTFDFVNSHLLNGVATLAELTKTDNRQPTGKIKPTDKMVMMPSLFDGTKPAMSKQHYEIQFIYVVPPQSWGDRSDTKHSKCLLLGGRRLNQLTLIPKPKGSGGARAAMAQVGPANNRNDTKRCLPIEASLRPGEAVPW